MEQLDRVPNLPIETRFERVRALALLAGLGKDPKSGVTAAEADGFANRSVAALRGAIDAGWAVRDEGAGIRRPPRPGRFQEAGGRGGGEVRAESQAKRLIAPTGG